MQSAGPAAITNDVFDLPRRVAEPPQSRRNRFVDDFEVAATCQFLELHQSEVRLDAGGITVHYQGYSTGRGDASDLRVAIAVLLAQLPHAIAFALGSLE